MTVRFAAALSLACLAGCAPRPTVTKGTFAASHTLTMQRGSIDVLVKTTGPATYAVTNHRMDHPMGRRPDTEATFTTPAGTFSVSDRGLSEPGVSVNGTFYPVPPRPEGRTTVTIDEKGGVTVSPPKEAAPQGGKP
jgi:hypothetical protein